MCYLNFKLKQYGGPIDETLPLGQCLIQRKNIFFHLFFYKQRIEFWHTCKNVTIVTALFVYLQCKFCMNTRFIPTLFVK